MKVSSRTNEEVEDMIAVGTPVHAGSVHGFDAYFRFWRDQPLPARLIVAVNGSAREEVARQVETKLLSCTHLRFELLVVETRSDETDLLAAQRAIIASAVRQDDRHLLWHEVSRRPTAAALEYLIACEHPVAGALYKDTYQQGYYCVWEFDAVSGRHQHKPYLSINTIRRPTRVDAIGFGFTKVRTDLFEAVPLRATPGSASDTHFCVGLRERGVPIHACPVFVKNVKIDDEPAALRTWRRRRRLLLANASKSGRMGRAYELVREFWRPGY